MEKDLLPQLGQHSCRKEGNHISSPHAETRSTKMQKGNVRHGLLEPGSGSQALSLPSSLSAAPSYLQDTVQGWVGQKWGDVKHEGQTNVGVFIFCKKLLFFSESWCQAICLRDFAHSKFSNSPFLISAEHSQSLEKKDTDVRADGKEWGIEVCCLNIFCTLCKQI